jgi:hypothetical protein
VTVAFGSELYWTTSVKPEDARLMIEKSARESEAAHGHRQGEETVWVVSCHAV